VSDVDGVAAELKLFASLPNVNVAPQD